MADLARDLPDAERYRRLLDGLRTLVPCDAAAMLKLDGEVLVPLAVDGLTADTLGRRFRVADHPRLKQLLEATHPIRFPQDSPLPDPYDGLVEGVLGHLHVHDCMGCPLMIDGRPWGLLTLDALQSGQFSDVDLELLQAFASLAAAAVAVAARIDRLARQAEEAREEASLLHSRVSSSSRQLTGQSAAHKRMLQEVCLAAPSDLCVLIQGETGVGKELVAQAIHARSNRAARPLISINCAALPESLVESELFGHVRGAFTGASHDRKGKFELADGGTLFLDEVGELPLPTQAKLLRVLQGGQLQRLGSDREHQVDVRVIAASNRDLVEETRRGRLRPDFYHRISVYPIQVPPLRDRGRDVLLIAGYFLEEARSRQGGASLRLDVGAQNLLLAYPWPGNVRELEHVLGRAIIKAKDRQGLRGKVTTIVAEDLALTGTIAAPSPPSEPSCAATAASPAQGLSEAVEAFERTLIIAALERHQYQWAPAARELKMDRANLARLAKRLGIQRPGA